MGCLQAQLDPGPQMASSRIYLSAFPKGPGNSGPPVISLTTPQQGASSSLRHFWIVLAQNVLRSGPPPWRLSETPCLGSSPHLLSKN